MRLEACDVSSCALAAIATGPRPGRVHSVFAHTVNILCAGDLWVSLHPRGVPRHPYSVTVGAGPCGPGTAPAPQGRFLDGAAGEAARVSLAGIELGAGRVAVSLDAARTWDCAAGPIRPALPSEPAGAILRIREAIGEPGKRGVESPFLKAVLERGGNAATTATCEAGVHGLLRRRAAQLLERMEDAWESRSQERLAAAMLMAVGLGVGLTPAGDDFILGLMAASYYSRESGLAEGEGLAASCICAIDRTAGLTTVPSRFMLKAAARGLWPEPIRDLVTSLGEGDLPGLGRAAARTLSLGATSGEDMLAGVIFGLELASIGERCHATNPD